MAKVRLKLGDNELEVDSRDFYVDNQTLYEVISSMACHLPEGRAELVWEEQPPAPATGLEALENAEAHEPEFAPPEPLAVQEIPAKLRILGTAKFFDSPRTVTETVEQLREYGWAAAPLDVSKALAKLASTRALEKSRGDARARYCTKAAAMP